MESKVDDDRPKVVRRGGYVLKRNAKGETELHVAIIRKQENRVENLLSKGHPVNVTDNGGWYPLHEACNYGLVKILELLLGTPGINVDAEGGDDKVTPMMDAVENGYYDVVEMLLKKGASTTKTDRRNQTILDYLKNRGDRVDESLTDERHRLQLIAYIEERWKEQNFIPPVKYTANRDKNLKRSDLLKRRKRQKIETMKRCLGNDDDDEPLVKSSADVQNAKAYHKTIAAVGKSAVQRPISTTYDPFQVDDDKPSLIPEEDFEVQEDWLDDDLNLFNKRKDQRPRIKRPISFSSSDDDEPNVSCADMFDDFNEPSTCDYQPSVSSSSTNVESVVGSSSGLYDNQIDEKMDNDVELISCYKRPTAFADRQKKRKLRQTKLILPFAPSRPIRSDSPPSVFEQEYLPRRLSSKEFLPYQPKIGTRPLPNETINVVSIPTNIPKTTKVVVKIEGKKFLVPILDSDLDKNIGWFANQAAIRFSSNHGRKPLLRLFNADNVEIGINDGINLFLNEELVAEVISWDLLPLHAKYEEICKNFNGIMYTNLKSALRFANDTNELNLENSGCKGPSAMHLLQTIQDGYGLTSINLRGNRLTTENAKDLGVALPLLKSLKMLSLRNTGLSNEHIVRLVDGVQSSGDGKIASLQNLDMSFNFFDDNVKEMFEKLLRSAPSLVGVCLMNCASAPSFGDVAALIGLSIVK